MLEYLPLYYQTPMNFELQSVSIVIRVRQDNDAMMVYASMLAKTILPAKMVSVARQSTMNQHV